MANPALTLVSIAIALGAAPAAASASTIRLEPGGEDEAPHLVYRAAPGEQNRLSIAVSGSKATVDDPGATIAVQQGCASVTPQRATCDLQSSTSRIEFADVELGDGDDTFVISGAQAVANGGPGSDTLNGGDSFDILNGGGGGTDVLHGGAGGDALNDGDTSGDSNADVLDGGTGGASVDYSRRTEPVTVDLASGAPGGEAGEGDALTGIVDVTGGEGADVLRGNGAANQLWGGAGNDTLDGRGGADYLTGGTGNDLLIGGPGSDAFSDGTGDDVLQLDNPPGTRDRYLFCEAGNDLVVGPGPSPSIGGCERADFGSGFVIAVRPVKLTRKLVRLAIPCVPAFRGADGRCRGALVVEPVNAYARSKKVRRRQRFGRAEFAFGGGGSHGVTAVLNAAGRRELRKRFLRLQFTVVLKDAASGTTRRFAWTAALSNEP
jgi:hypothetical protein